MYDRQILETWKRAVIHLECATDSVGMWDRIKQSDADREQYELGKMSLEEISERFVQHSRDVRFRGTAVFVRHHDRRYLVTARHLLHDDLSAEREIKDQLEGRWGAPPSAPDDIDPEIVEGINKRIFSIIFRVPGLDETANASMDGRPEYLMNVGAGGYIRYTFSDPETDLAIISLEGTELRFSQDLESRGYQAIPSDEFNEGPSAEGAEVFTVGFPNATAILETRPLSRKEAHWASAAVSLPVFAFGKIAMLHSSLPFFWSDMSIYPGNSGGPVIEGRKLVGIVSAQATIPIEGPNPRGPAVRIPFAKAVKAGQLRLLLDEQLAKDEFDPRHALRHGPSSAPDARDNR